jgi:hypothetical protein
MPIVDIELVTTENACGVASQAMPALSPILFRKFGFLPMKRQIAAVIAPQNCYLLRNIR